MAKDTLSKTAALRALLSETPDAHVLAEMLGFVADQLMALDVDQLCGAGSHERSVDRVNHRDGYRSRAWETLAGTVEVQIPKLRLLPGVSGATASGGEGYDGRHPRSVCPGTVHPIGR